MTSASAVMQLRVEVIRYRPHSGSPTLKAWVDLRVPSLGLRVNRVALHRSSTGMTWLAMPATQVRSSASSVWVPLVEFTSPGAYQQFQMAALAAVRDYQARSSSRETS